MYHVHIQTCFYPLWYISITPMMPWISTVLHTLHDILIYNVQLVMSEQGVLFCYSLCIEQLHVPVSQTWSFISITLPYTYQEKGNPIYFKVPHMFI